MTTGVGMYPSLGAATSSVKHALHDQIAAALAAADETEVDVRFGFLWPTEWFDSVAVTAVRATPDEGTVSPQRTRHLTVYVDVSIVSFRVTADDAEPHDRAYGLLGVIDAHLREDPTMAGAALWCFSDELTSDGATDEVEAEVGRLCEIAVTYAARVIVTR
ncbi:hypothetical protein [Cellulosimicrobium sp. 22601]|uniref:hypothetical protein n=1 Tax=unclassified Cellulosimicrobium TaxID=2624466 RepID=UPI003F8649A3